MKTSFTTSKYVLHDIDVDNRPSSILNIFFVMY